MTESEQCQFCNHSKNDHELKRQIEDGVIVKKWRGACDWHKCRCEIYESPDGQTSTIFRIPRKKIPRKKTEKYVAVKASRKIFVCGDCGRGFTKKVSLASHKSHCLDVQKRMMEAQA